MMRIDPIASAGRSPMHENDVSRVILDASLEIHRRLGPGLLESVYSAVLAHELRKRGLRVQVEVPIPVVWDTVQLDVGFRADVIVEDLVVVELKSSEWAAPVHVKQTLTYTRLANKRLGLLINFGMELLMDGFVRVANGLEEEGRAEAQGSQREEAEKRGKEREMG